MTTELLIAINMRHGGQSVAVGRLPLWKTQSLASPWASRPCSPANKSLWYFHCRRRQRRHMWWRWFYCCVNYDYGDYLGDVIIVCLDLVVRSEFCIGTWRFDCFTLIALLQGAATATLIWWTSDMSFGCKNLWHLWLHLHQLWANSFCFDLARACDTNSDIRIISYLLIN